MNYHMKNACVQSRHRFAEEKESESKSRKI